MNYPVIKAASYVLVHAPSIMINNGTTLTMERAQNPHSKFLIDINNHIRDFDTAVGYAPNQVYIGNLPPEQLEEVSKPCYENSVSNNKDGKFGEIIDEAEFYGLIKLADSFNLVELSEEFSPKVLEKLNARELFSKKRLSVLEKSKPIAEIEELVSSNKAQGLYLGSNLIGCVREAHETDPNLNSHVILENLVSKASGILAINNLKTKHNLNPDEIDYIIETSEEAIGDMNQRGGGNMAKAIGEVCMLKNATGADIRAFCAAPAHGILKAASLVKAGIFKNVVVVAGGSSAKLGMNSRDHINKDIPVLEDMVAGFAVLVSENDGINPIIRTDNIGTHTIGSGSSPQAVIKAVVIDPLQKNNMKVSDINKYAPELQNPEITVPAGAGDVPLANYKMIAAMAVKNGEIEKDDILEFAKKHGVIGFAPTQGHIPSGIPLIGHIRQAILDDNLNNSMIIGKGSLFLGRMTDLFDGISFIIEKNSGVIDSKQYVSDEDAKQQIREIIAEILENVVDSTVRR
ncbi:Glycine/sarcosine/betaine reductase component C chain 1 [Candidatus Syntrophocurvum alkaliphilum]|uniref:Glycine/sarcosine/betaine reductase component C chain 1 n=1 Tax=Candidatus Syntrophocurvum alkaliphilum TaxID=2293317 RepID=A0A6I6DFF8_9FIRM|nr:glycine/sarcosine/betaine reductase complex component C subunit beta [Candidatus Syntrophocurvum alkaliphilum]QGT99886.1 Glycine/sarcosine/betaine reductase component C chain 1 [Candidatus Syntrophocurvum alkaliphilum]